MRSPATVGTVNRADAQRGQAGTDKQPVDYYRLARRVEEPNAHHLTVYNGRERMGSILEIDGTCFAFGFHDEPLGSFPSRKLAFSAVSASHDPRRAA